VSELRDAALRYSGLGRPVFPCNGKRPFVANGLNDATTDRAVIEKWWQRWPQANVAVRTGAASRLLVLDVDGQEGADSLHELERQHGELPTTESVKTPRGGAHHYFRHPGRPYGTAPASSATGSTCVRTAVTSSPRRHRGYVADEQVPLADLPDWLLGLLRDERRDSAPPVDDEIPEGKRNAELASLAGTMRRRGMGEAEILAALLVTNAERCGPPLEDAEVERIASSVGRYPPAASKSAEALGELLGQSGVGRRVSGARIVGRGARASADLYLSDGTAVEFESLREFANPTRLAVEMAAATGVVLSLKVPEALRALALLRELAEHTETASADDVATDWGLLPPSCGDAHARHERPGALGGCIALARTRGRVEE
jgi:Bifunctional DNA primase/polymerase, N-terminal/Primase C terminal 1 (PriCT-1)